MTFDDIYANVPTKQVERLKQFRLSHQCKRLTVDNAECEYIACGDGEQTLLLLPGALSVGESLFPLIEAFETEYRIIAPSYALSSTMTGLCEGIDRILEFENVDQVHLMGGSYGGLVAQHFVRRYPVKVRSLVLSHTFVLTQKFGKPLWLAGKVFGVFPQSLFVPLVKLRLDKMLVSTLRAAKHPETEFWRAYLNEAVQSGLLKDVFMHQNQCLVELLRHSAFTPDDLKDWNGRILIIDSDDDPAISAGDRGVLRRMYPRAKVHTFKDAGHASSILKREEVVSIVKDFIRGS